MIRSKGAAAEEPPDTLTVPVVRRMCRVSEFHIGISYMYGGFWVPNKSHAMGSAKGKGIFCPKFERRAFAEEVFVAPGIPSPLAKAGSKVQSLSESE